MSRELQTRWVGRISYGDALAMQEEIVARKRADQSLGDELLLLEHEPVYTIGRTPDRSSLRGAAHLPHPLVPINRGGQATYHGPGQLVGYPIVDLRDHGQDLHRYLRWMEEVVIELLATFCVHAQTRSGLTGVWVEDRKIASIGVGVRQWITMHGFALNVSGDLSAFDEIVPCGIANVTMTSIEKESGDTWPVEQVAARASELFATRMADLRARTAVAT
ncbi:MAG: lipoyl(octanoyl) transferase LipB [Chthoniobacterales bacterium]|nr:lipoyl(octanoyl) transferase LipB [Chthoniobacterales bacterium]